MKQNKQKKKEKKKEERKKKKKKLERPKPDFRVYPSLFRSWQSKNKTKIKKTNGKRIGKEKEKKRKRKEKEKKEK